MAFTGDLEHLPIVDIIQLVHTTRRSGIFFVKGDKGESKIVFSRGSIVGANHMSDSVRIGTVLVKSGAVSIEDLKQALSASREAGTDRKPLMAVLMEMGKLKREDAVRGLKKLVEMTIVELMSWTKGTFTFDTDTFVFSPEGGAAIGDTDQDVAIDAQMVLMDALRIFDERERDREKGKEVPSFDSLYADVLPEEKGGGSDERTAITAAVLGLDDLDRLEKKIPRPAPELKVLDPVEIHRQNIREILGGFSPEEQEALVSFLRKSAGPKSTSGDTAQQADKAVVLFSSDNLIRHAIMTLCKDEGVAVFAPEDEADLEWIVSQCLSAMRMPVVVLDSPEDSGSGFPAERIIGLRDRVKEKHPAVSILQFASPRESSFILQSYRDGVRAVFPKPLREAGKETYIRDTMTFLDAFRSYVKGFPGRTDTADRYVKELKDNIRSLREVDNASDAALVILAAVAEMFERAVTFIVRPTELIGERAIGVSQEKSMGPAPANRLRIPLAKPSIFRDALEQGAAYYGESSDEALKGLFQEIGKPLSPAVVLLPVTCERKVVAIVYGDFGKKAASPVHLDILEIAAQQVGIVLEYALFRRQVAKASQKP